MSVFHFKNFDVDDCGCGMKICSDSVLLAAWFMEDRIPMHPRSVLDIGTGSGILALLAAEILPEAHITGIEIDESAARAADANFKASPWSDRLEIVNSSFKTFAPTAPADIIISNPPFFTNGIEATDCARATARHQSDLNYSSLIRYAAAKLIKNGHLGLISPAEFESDIIFEAELAGLKLHRLCRVASTATKIPSRLLWDFARTDITPQIETLTLRDSVGLYSVSYRSLVEKYYQKFSER